MNCYFFVVEYWKNREMMLKRSHVVKSDLEADMVFVEAEKFVEKGMGRFDDGDVRYFVITEFKRI
jgi:hypothetical protein